ncbi:MAG: hypothetical protein NTZ63_07005 [Candidatus Omnitrophica bacterium]|nr:hypothetical protein [Candidatus Omnitrophota bacterium]
MLMLELAILMLLTSQIFDNNATALALDPAYSNYALVTTFAPADPSVSLTTSYGNAAISEAEQALPGIEQIIANAGQYAYTEDIHAMTDTGAPASSMVRDMIARKWKDEATQTIQDVAKGTQWAVAASSSDKPDCRGGCNPRFNASVLEVTRGEVDNVVHLGNLKMILSSEDAQTFKTILSGYNPSLDPIIANTQALREMSVNKLQKGTPIGREVTLITPPDYQAAAGDKIGFRVGPNGMPGVFSVNGDSNARSVQVNDPVHYLYQTPGGDQRVISLQNLRVYNYNSDTLRAVSINPSSPEIINFSQRLDARNEPINVAEYNNSSGMAGAIYSRNGLAAASFNDNTVLKYDIPRSLFNASGQDLYASALGMGPLRGNDNKWVPSSTAYSQLAFVTEANQTFTHSIKDGKPSQGWNNFGALGTETKATSLETNWSKTWQVQPADNGQLTFGRTVESQKPGDWQFNATGMYTRFTNIGEGDNRHLSSTPLAPNIGIPKGETIAHLPFYNAPDGGLFLKPANTTDNVFAFNRVTNVPYQWNPSEFVRTEREAGRFIQQGEFNTFSKPEIIDSTRTTFVNSNNASVAAQAAPYSITGADLLSTMSATRVRENNIETNMVDLKSNRVDGPGIWNLQTVNLKGETINHAITNGFIWSTQDNRFTSNTINQEGFNFDAFKQYHNVIPLANEHYAVNLHGARIDNGSIIGPGKAQNYINGAVTLPQIVIDGYQGRNAIDVFADRAGRELRTEYKNVTVLREHDYIGQGLQQFERLGGRIDQTTTGFTPDLIKTTLSKTLPNLNLAVIDKFANEHYKNDHFNVSLDLTKPGFSIDPMSGGIRIITPETIEILRNGKVENEPVIMFLHSHLLNAPSDGKGKSIPNLGQGINLKWISNIDFGSGIDIAEGRIGMFITPQQGPVDKLDFSPTFSQDAVWQDWARAIPVAESQSVSVRESVEGKPEKIETRESIKFLEPIQITDTYGIGKKGNNAAPLRIFDPTNPLTFAANENAVAVAHNKSRIDSFVDGHKDRYTNFNVEEQTVHQLFKNVDQLNAYLKANKQDQANIAATRLRNYFAEGEFTRPDGFKFTVWGGTLDHGQPKLWVKGENFSVDHQRIPTPKTDSNGQVTNNTSVARVSGIVGDQVTFAKALFTMATPVEGGVVDGKIRGFIQGSVYNDLSRAAGADWYGNVLPKATSKNGQMADVNGINISGEYVLIPRNAVKDIISYDYYTLDQNLPSSFDRRKFEYNQSYYFAGSEEGSISGRNDYKLDVKRFLGPGMDANGEPNFIRRTAQDENKNMGSMGEVVNAFKGKDLINAQFSELAQAQGWYMDKSGEKVFRFGQVLGEQDGKPLPVSVFDSFKINTPTGYQVQQMKDGKLVVVRSDDKGNPLPAQDSAKPIILKDNLSIDVTKATYDDKPTFTLAKTLISEQYDPASNKFNAGLVLEAGKLTYGNVKVAEYANITAEQLDSKKITLPGMGEFDVSKDATTGKYTLSRNGVKFEADFVAGKDQLRVAGFNVDDKGQPVGPFALPISRLVTLDDKGKPITSQTVFIGAGADQKENTITYSLVNGGLMLNNDAGRLIRQTALGDTGYFNAKVDGIETKAKSLWRYEQLTDQSKGEAGWAVPSNRTYFKDSLAFNVSQDGKDRAVVAQDTRMSMQDAKGNIIMDKDGRPAKDMFHYLIEGVSFARPDRASGTSGESSSYVLGYNLDNKDKVFPNAEGMLTAKEALMPVLMGLDNQGELSFNVVSLAKGLSYKYESAGTATYGNLKLDGVNKDITVDNGKVVVPDGQYKGRETRGDLRVDGEYKVNGEKIDVVSQRFYDKEGKELNFSGLRNQQGDLAIDQHGRVWNVKTGKEERGEVAEAAVLRQLTENKSFIKEMQDMQAKVKGAEDVKITDLASAQAFAKMVQEGKIVEGNKEAMMAQAEEQAKKLGINSLTLVYSPKDSSLLVFKDNESQQAFIYDKATGKLIRSPDYDKFQPLPVSKDGKLAYDRDTLVHKYLGESGSDKRNNSYTSNLETFRKQHPEFTLVEDPSRERSLDKSNRNFPFKAQSATEHFYDVYWRGAKVGHILAVESKFAAMTPGEKDLSALLYRNQPQRAWPTETTEIKNLKIPVTSPNLEHVLFFTFSNRGGELRPDSWDLIRTPLGSRDRLSGIRLDSDFSGDFSRRSFVEAEQNSRVDYARMLTGLGYPTRTFPIFNRLDSRTEFANDIISGHTDWGDAQGILAHNKDNTGFRQTVNRILYTPSVIVIRALNRSSEERAVQTNGSIVWEALTDAAFVVSGPVRAISGTVEVLRVASTTVKVVEAGVTATKIVEGGATAAKVIEGGVVAVKTFSDLGTVGKIIYVGNSVVKPAMVYGSLYGIAAERVMTNEERAQGMLQ